MNIPEILKSETSEFLSAISACDNNSVAAAEVVRIRFDCLKLAIASMEREWRQANTELRPLQDWFRAQTAAVLERGRLIRRMRTWPEGYPGDYITLETVYSNQPEGTGLAQHLDWYVQTRTLSVAVRSRLRRLVEILNRRVREESGQATWLNIGCGSCRELLSVAPPRSQRKIHLLDMDANALAFAKELTFGKQDGLEYHKSNAFRLVNKQRNITTFGNLTTIYSAGFFDYVKDETLSQLLNALFMSLKDGGVLIAPFKDMKRYETFDFHWSSRWYDFLQRTEDDMRRVFHAADIPSSAITAERDESGVILFFVVRKQ